MPDRPSAVPRPSRMTSPGYGFQKATSPPGERFPWSRVEELLASVRACWIGTTRPNGRPHAAPVWGVWLDGVLYFSTGKESRKGRNLAANPAAAAHIEGAEGEMVILEGFAEEIGDATALAPVWVAYSAKYDWAVEGYPFYALRPQVAFSFREDLGETATRWTFADS